MAFAADLLPSRRYNRHRNNIAAGLLVSLWGEIAFRDTLLMPEVSDHDIEQSAGWFGRKAHFAATFRKHFISDGECVLWNQGRFSLLRKDSRRRPDIPIAIKRAVFERDGYRCTHCGSENSLELDHIILWSKGGEHEVDNLRVLCWPCHRERHRRDGSSTE